MNAKDIKNIYSSTGKAVRLWATNNSGALVLIRDFRPVVIPEDPDEPEEPQEPALTSTKQLPFLYGYAWDQQKSRVDYNLALTQDARIINPENAFGPGHVCPSSKLNSFKNLAEVSNPDNYNWDFLEADASVAFARANNMTVHISHLTWHGPTEKDHVHQIISDNPGREKEFLTAYYKMRITKVMTRYRDEPIVTGANVMNEAIENDGTQKKCEKANWFTLSEFFIMSFTAAITAAPNKFYFANDYNYENGTWERMNTTMALVDELYAKNLYVGNRRIKCDGIGFQFHTTIEPDWDIARGRMQAVAAKGLLYMYSELDADTGRAGSIYTLREDLGEASMEAKVSKLYWNSVIHMLKAVPLNQIYAYIIWSVTDRDNFMQTQVEPKNTKTKAPGTTNAIEKFPVPRDWWGKKKEAYQAILDAYKNPPMSGKIFQDFEDGFWISNIKDTMTKGAFPQKWKQTGNTAVIAMNEIGLAQKQASTNTYSLLTVPTLSTTYRLESKFGRMIGSTNRTQNLIFRVQDANNMIMVASKYASSTDQYYALILRKGGLEDNLIKVPGIVPKKDDEIRVDVTPTKISLYINGVSRGSVNNSDFGSRTEAGLRFKGYNDKYSAIKDFRLN